jgi:hypothetical protein
MSFHPLPRAGARIRWFGALAALLTTSGVLTALLGAFFLASSQPWLLPTPDVLAAAADCRALNRRVEQEACLSQLVATRSQAPRAARLAAASAPGGRR